MWWSSRPLVLINNSRKAYRHKLNDHIGKASPPQSRNFIEENTVELTYIDVVTYEKNEPLIQQSIQVIHSHSAWYWICNPRMVSHSQNMTLFPGLRSSVTLQNPSLAQVQYIVATHWFISLTKSTKTTRYPDHVAAASLVDVNKHCVHVDSAWSHCDVLSDVTIYNLGSNGDVTMGS